MLQTEIELRVGSILTGDLDLSSKTKAALDFAKTYSLANGTDQGEADQLWFDARTIGAGLNDDLDLTGGITNGLNQAVTFARVKFMMVFSTAANAGAIKVGGATDPFDSWLGAATDSVKVMPGGCLWLIAPDAVAYPVVPLTDDKLRIANPNASGINYEIVLVGTTV